MNPTDSHLLFLLNHEWTHPVLDRLLGTLSCTPFWVPFFIVWGLGLIWKFRSRGFACVVVCAFSVLINESVISSPLKKLTHRARPHQAQEGVRRVDLAPANPKLLAAFKPLIISFSAPPNPLEQYKRSFPSSHTLNATTLGLVFALFLRTPAWLLLPLLMAWSRVYTGAHWPSDVTASILMGLLSNALILLGAERFWRSRIATRYPELHAMHPTLFFSTPPSSTNTTSPPRDA